ncbi:peptidoglycan-associated lipoprotein Pal [Chitiniphilus purpureus]|uniref:Peptidoglycan-associated lipoprotein n=1 Tax=Chitiniphilus purpureus TaxID=2981137 RepID=A0ABY6DMP0_9NEIS|nr:peptidoglycan-associated lipoprotein Pal [Chitiniphilus sp. CD1]UXY15639.1 peptidoglycan-associated lipoprotein Pal [Chitiniphilus sp. CD1]
MKQIALSLALTALLAACASQPKTDTGAATPTPAPVVDAAPSPAAPAPAPQGNDLAQKGYNPLTDPNNVLSSRRVYFDYDAYVVKGEYTPLVEAHAKYLLDNKDAKVILQGHADNRGTAEYNLALGQKRADAVKKNMAALGVPEAQIETVSFGEEKPAEQGDTEEAWSRNRRAEIVYQSEQ